MADYDVVLKLTDAENYKWVTTDNAEVTLTFRITKATNMWEITPDISGRIYGETVNEPLARQSMYPMAK